MPKGVPGVDEATLLILIRRMRLPFLFSSSALRCEKGYSLGFSGVVRLSGREQIFGG